MCEAQSLNFYLVFGFIGSCWSGTRWTPHIIYKARRLQQEIEI